jgi:hypothetical protein
VQISICVFSTVRYDTLISSRVIGVLNYAYHRTILAHELHSYLFADGEGVKTSQTRATIVVLHGRTIPSRLLLNAQVVHANILIVATTSTSNNSRVAKVVVDSNEVRCHTTGADIFNHDLARTVCPVVGAVTAAPVEFSRVGDGVVANGHASLSVVLDDLVVGARGTASLDENIAWSKSCDGICNMLVVLSSLWVRRLSHLRRRS